MKSMSFGLTRHIDRSSCKWKPKAWQELDRLEATSSSGGTGPQRDLPVGVLNSAVTWSGLLHLVWDRVLFLLKKHGSLKKTGALM